MNRHWDRIAKLTGHTFDVENENFQLRNIMEAPLLTNKEDIEVKIYFIYFCFIHFYFIYLSLFYLFYFIFIFYFIF